MGISKDQQESQASRECTVDLLHDAMDVFDVLHEPTARYSLQQVFRSHGMKHRVAILMTRMRALMYDSDACSQHKAWHYFGRLYS